MVLNNAERLTYDICRRTSLSLWSYANPVSSDGKELGDVLVVCDPDVVLVSVKEVSGGKAAGFAENGAVDG